MGILKDYLSKLSCHHEWFVHSEVSAENRDTGTIALIRQTLICKKCGKIKQITL